jgi:Uma2 family endonuclease
VTNLALKYDNLFTYADYRAWPETDRFELIDGIAYAMSSPSETHQAMSGELLLQFGNFLRRKPCRVYHAPFDVRLFPKEDESDTTVVQPDLLVVCDMSKLSDGRACRGAPDLVVEIQSFSTSLMDRKVKRELYEEAGVREYWIVNPETFEVLVYTRENGRYTSRKCRGSIPVMVLPGLEIDMDAARVAVTLGMRN